VPATCCPALNLVAKSVFNGLFMSLSSRRFGLSRLLLPLFLGASWSLAHAQTRASQPASRASSPLALLLGASLGGLVVGGLAGAALRRNFSGPAAQASDATFEVAPLPMCEMNADERIERENSSWSALLGTSSSTQTTFSALLHPDDLAPVRAGLLSLFEGENAHFQTSARFFRPDGVLVTAHLEARATANGRRPDRILIGLQDASELCEAKRELDGARAAIRALYEVMAGDKTADLNSKIKSLLALGCGRLELPFGALSRLTTFEDGTLGLETVWVQSPDRRVRPALALRRGDDSLEGRLLGLPLLPSPSSWRAAPCVAGQQGATFLAAPVEVNGQWFGMLSFSSSDTGHSGFDTSETELLGLMAQWVGSEIEREEARAALEASQLQMAQANRKLELLATIDPLTEAKNRRAWNEKLAEEWSRATRYGTPLSLVLLDVDKFKTYNDTFGHQAGDEVLRRVAQTAQSAIRVTDFLARYGGEEFALILPNTDAQGALVLAERLRAAIEGAPWKERPVTASFGIATLDGDMKSSDDLTRAADEALYGAKEQGRNRVLHVSEMTVAATV